MKYTILEFKDGLQLVPSKWLMDGQGKSFYPPFISQLRVDKAIEEQEDPGTDWKMYNVQRIFGTAATYKQGIKKLNLAMRFLEIDNEDSMEESKQSRVAAAHKRLRDELDDDCPPKRVLSPLQVMRHLQQDQNIQVIYTPPPFGQPFYTSSIQPPSMRSEIDINNSYLGSSTIQREQNEVSDLTKFVENLEKEISQKFNKLIERLETVNKIIEERFIQIVDEMNQKQEAVDKIYLKLQKLDKVIEKLKDVDKIYEKILTIDVVNEKLQTVDEMNEKLDIINQRIGKIQARDRMNDSTETVAREPDENVVSRMVAQFFNDIEENMFPINSVEGLEEFERKLQNPGYFMQMVNIFKEIEGKDVYTLVTGILKKMLTNELAEQYSWLGRKGKRVFKPFTLNKVILETVRVHYNTATEGEVNNVICRWLVAAKTRKERTDSRNRRSLPGKLYSVNE